MKKIKKFIQNNQNVVLVAIFVTAFFAGNFTNPTYKKADKALKKTILATPTPTPLTIPSPQPYKNPELDENIEEIKDGYYINHEFGFTFEYDDAFWKDYEVGTWPDSTTRYIKIYKDINYLYPFIQVNSSSEFDSKNFEKIKRMSIGAETKEDDEWHFSTTTRLENTPYGFMTYHTSGGVYESEGFNFYGLYAQNGNTLISLGFHTYIDSEFSEFEKVTNSFHFISK